MKNKSAVHPTELDGERKCLGVIAFCLLLCDTGSSAGFSFVFGTVFYAANSVGIDRC